MENERIDFIKDNQPFQTTAFDILYLSLFKYDGGWQGHPHTHQFTEFFYIVNGSCQFIVEEKILTVHKNDIVIINPNTEHAEKSLDDKSLQYLAFGVNNLTLRATSHDQPINYWTCSYSSNRRQLFNISQLLRNELSSKGKAYEAICHGIISLFLTYIISNDLFTVSTVKDNRVSKECAMIKRYLDANYAQNITLDSLAEHTHLSKFYLSRIFSRCLGMSPINYLNQKRIQMAKEILVQTDRPLIQIAANIGFTSPSYFSQIFKKATGISPSQYRKLYTTKEETTAQ